MLNNFCFHFYAQKSLSHSHTLTLSHALILSFTISRHAEQLLFSCLCSKVTLSLSHSLTLTLSHSHTHSHTLTRSHSLIHSLPLPLSHALTLDMLNNFCFHVYAQKSLSHTLSISDSITRDILNNFCFHVYAQKSLSHSHTLSLFHSLTLSFTLSRHAEQLLFSRLCSKVAV